MKFRMLMLTLFTLNLEDKEFRRNEIIYTGSFRNGNQSKRPDKGRLKMSAFPTYLCRHQ